MNIMNMPNNVNTEPKYGITGPVSFKESSPEDIEMTKALDKYLRDSEFFESEDEAQTRERVLGKLDFMVKRFVAQTSPESEGKNYGGKIFTFGSYRLGVHNKGADIDVLCVAPRHVVRKDFFTIFYDELAKDEDVSDLSKVEEAYAPLIKLKFHGIPIDMTFARLNLPVVKENTTLLNDNILKSMDEKCITSLNGSRVTDAMLHLVPNVSAFHSALRAVKFWAKRRCIYGNTYGYLGGVAYSICVARICQMFPNATAYEVLTKFFEIYTSWKWPAPVILCPITDHNFNMKVWDPKVNPADKYHRMPVITPVYPSKCSTHNVTQSTFNAMCAEFQRGHDLIKAKAPFPSLFEPSDFFKKHKMFVEVSISSDTKEAFSMWAGYIESKIRILSTKLENLECIVAAIPFPKAFKPCRKTAANSISDSKEKTAASSNSDKEKPRESTDSKTIGLSSTAGNAINKISNENIKVNNQSNSVNNSCSNVSNQFNDDSRSERARGFVGNECDEYEGVSKARKVTLESPANRDNNEKDSVQKDSIGECSDQKDCAVGDNGGEKEENGAKFYIAIDVFMSAGSSRKFYIGEPIDDFMQFVNAWEMKTSEMRIEINSKKRKEVHEQMKDGDSLND